MKYWSEVWSTLASGHQEERELGVLHTKCFGWETEQGEHSAQSHQQCQEESLISRQLVKIIQ